jgi:hypothetical protein
VNEFKQRQRAWRQVAYWNRIARTAATAKERAEALQLAASWRRRAQGGATTLRRAR